MPRENFLIVSIGRRIRERREHVGMTIAELARRIGKGKASVQHYEDGADNISAATLYAVARALGVEVGHFYGETVATDSEGVLLLMKRLSPRMQRVVLAMIRAAVESDAGAYDSPADPAITASS